MFEALTMVEPEIPTGSSILVVDDDPSVLAMLQAVLQNEGYVITTATNAADARTQLEKHSFDVVLTDMRMETETAGFDVVRDARSRPEKPLIVILTAYPMLETQWREAGADAGWMKGMPVTQLTDNIAKLLIARAQHR